jgi:hypothetical protein
MFEVRHKVKLTNYALRHGDLWGIDVLSQVFLYSTIVER